MFLNILSLEEITCISARWLVCLPCSRSATFLQESNNKCDKLFYTFIMQNTSKANMFYIRLKFSKRCPSTDCVCLLTVGGCGPSTPRCRLGRPSVHCLSSNRLCKPPQHRLHRGRGGRSEFKFYSKSSFFSIRVFTDCSVC